MAKAMYYGQGKSFLKNAFNENLLEQFLPTKIPFMALWQSTYQNLPVSVSFVGKDSIDPICSSSFPILFHMMYQIPAIDKINYSRIRFLIPERRQNLNKDTYPIRCEIQC
jgi:hypothetical protein